jgi:hypothetical protein
VYPIADVEAVASLDFRGGVNENASDTLIIAEISNSPATANLLERKPRLQHQGLDTQCKFLNSL